MASHCCFVVPPYLLQSISEASCNSEEIRSKAKSALALRDKVIQVREERLAFYATPRGHRGQMAAPRAQGIVPDILLQHIADSEDVDEDTRKCARRDLEHLHSVHARVHDLQAGTAEAPQQKMLAAAAGKGKPKQPETTYRAVYDAKHGDESDLPGKLVRSEGQASVKDDAVNEAFDNVGHVLEMYRETWSWKSIDNQNMQVISSVHFGTNYENAFWDPEKMQMVFGDGDTFLKNFTGCIDVIGHEMTHAVVEHTSPLDYQGQSGALNEHVADVFGIMVKQKIENEKADEADWLIGEGCLVPGVKGVALRNMKEPGTAYDDPRFGKDPQPAHFSKYVPMSQDNGGVHIYSGIPNRAFYLCAKEFGGYSWEKAGQIWWKTMNSGRIPARCNFLQFAEVTEDIAEDLYGEEAATIVKNAWKEVGVVRKTR